MGTSKSECLFAEATFDSVRLLGNDELWACGFCHRIFKTEQEFKEHNHDIQFVTPFGWVIECRELGDGRLLVTWGNNHAIIIE